MKNIIKKYGVMFLFLFMAAIVSVMLITTIITMSKSTELIVESSSKKLISASKLVAEVARGEELEELFDWANVQSDDELYEKYDNLKHRLIDIATELDLEYAYLLRLNPDDHLMYFIVDNVLVERQEYDPNPFGGIPREEIPDAVMQSKKPQATKLGHYSEGYENYMTAFAPVFNSSGEVIALAGVDTEDQLIITASSNNMILTIVLISSMIALLTTGILALFLFRRKAVLAESANVAKSSFLSRMSHEMRTPMNAIIGLCRMAKETDNHAEISGYLDNISAASTHLRQVIDDVLDLSKIESGKAVQELIEVNLHKELASVELIIRTAAKNKNQTIIFKIDSALPHRLICDTTHLRQVVLNLLSNAVKFTPENGQISLTVSLLENDGRKCNVLWTVKDSGIGIDKENIDKLFRPFEQGDNTITRKFGGTGLGLAISRQYIEMMGGKISVESEKGKGSTFTFNSILHIPGKTDISYVPFAEPESEVYEKPDLTGKNILLVEDAELNRLIAENLFSGYGANVEIAVDGQDGYENFCKNPNKYDIIFMDIQMPVLDGYSAAKKIRASNNPDAKTVPIIAMTADVFREDVEKAIASGMNAHVGKPFDIEQIERVILKVLNEKK